MPRIAVAVIVVLTIGVSIGINIVRFPIVWEMVNPPSNKAAIEETASMPLPSVSQSRDIVDLNDFAPPSVTHGAASDSNLPPQPLETPAATPAAEPEDNLQSSQPAPPNGTIYFVSKLQPETPSSPLIGARTITDPNDLPVENGPRYEEQSVPEDAFAATATESPENRAFEPPPAMTFCPGSTAPPVTSEPFASLPDARTEDVTSNTDSSTSGTDSTAPAQPPSTTSWPARMAPALKFNANPQAVANDPDGWCQSAPMVPVAPNKSERLDPAPQTPPALPRPLVERFPKLPPNEQTTPLSYSRTPESLIPLYPNTGR